MFAYSSSGTALATQPLQTYIHKQPTHALTETATNLTPPPTHTDTDPCTDADTKRSQTPTQTRTPRRTRTATQPDPGRLVTDQICDFTRRHTRRCARRGHTRHTHDPQEPGCSGDGRHRVASRERLAAQAPLQAKPTEKPRPSAGRAAPAPPHLPWRRPSLTHRPGRGWPRRAPSSRRGAGGERGGRGPHRASGRLPGRALASLGPGGWSWGGGRRRH